MGFADTAWYFRGLSVQAAAVTSDAGAPKIRIKLKSYWKHMLSDAVEHIKEAAVSTNASFSGPVYLPTRHELSQLHHTHTGRPNYK